MGLNFKKSINLGGGIKLNVGKKSVGLSAGVKGARVSVNSKTGVKTTASIPGTGISYTQTASFKKNKDRSSSGKIPNLQVKNPLPARVYVPKVPSKIITTEIAAIVLLVIGIIFPPVLILALIAIISALVMMITNKEFKVSYYIQKAITFYKNGDFKRCVQYCNRVLEYQHNESAIILINNINEKEKAL